MPFTETMIYRALKQRIPIWRANDNTTGMPDNTPVVGPPLKARCFVVGENSALNDIEMVHCDCGMWNPMGHVCPCKWLPESNVAAPKPEPEPEYTAILDAPKPDYPFTCKNCGFQVLGLEHVCRVENRHKGIK